MFILFPNHQPKGDDGLMDWMELELQNALFFWCRAQMTLFQPIPSTGSPTVVHLGLFTLLWGSGRRGSWSPSNGPSGCLGGGGGGKRGVWGSLWPCPGPPWTHKHPTSLQPLVPPSPIFLLKFPVKPASPLPRPLSSWKLYCSVENLPPPIFHCLLIR